MVAPAVRKIVFSDTNLSASTSIQQPNSAGLATRETRESLEKSNNDVSTVSSVQTRIIPPSKLVALTPSFVSQPNARTTAALCLALSTVMVKVALFSPHLQVSTQRAIPSTLARSILTHNYLPRARSLRPTVFCVVLSHYRKPLISNYRWLRLSELVGQSMVSNPS
jgi:hypothetical protein